MTIKKPSILVILFRSIGGCSTDVGSTIVALLLDLLVKTPKNMTICLASSVNPMRCLIDALPHMKNHTWFCMYTQKTKTI